MPNRKYSVEQIVAKLREHEKLQGQGMTVVQACKRIGVSDTTFFRWRKRYGAWTEYEAHRLQELALANNRIKRIVAAVTLDIALR